MHENENRHDINSIINTTTGIPYKILTQRNKVELNITCAIISAFKFEFSLLFEPINQIFQAYNRFLTSTTLEISQDLNHCFIG